MTGLHPIHVIQYQSPFGKGWRTNFIADTRTHGVWVVCVQFLYDLQSDRVILESRNVPQECTTGMYQPAISWEPAESSSKLSDRTNVHNVADLRRDAAKRATPRACVAESSPDARHIYSAQTNGYARKMLCPHEPADKSIERRARCQSAEDYCFYT